MIRGPRLGLSLRTRLTLWYGGLLALTLLAVSALLYFTLQRNLEAGVDEALHLRASQIRRVLGPNPNATLGAGTLQPEDIPPGQVEADLLEEFAAPGIYPQVINARGAIVFAPSNLGGEGLPVTPAIVADMLAGQETLLTVPVQDGEANVRLLTVPLRVNDEVVGAIQVGQSLTPLESTMATVGRLLFSGGAGALLLAMVLGWLFTERALSPVARITATARHIAATGDYRKRLQVAEPPAGRGDELFALASTFNDVIERLEHVLESQRRLLADTSHELRNPLTVIRGNLALLRRDGIPDGTRRDAVLEAEAEAARMGRLVNDLLLLARADAGQLPSLQREPVDLAQVAREVVERARGSSAAGRTLAVAAPEDGSCRVLGDRDRLTQLVANLVDNAIRYTPSQGRIEVSVQAQHAPTPARSPVPGAHDMTPAPSHQPPRESVLLAVSDTGVGIAAEHLPHLFERFYRADRARSRSAAEGSGAPGPGGTGLGLAIAQYIARAHGGTLQAASEGPGRGSTFSLRLPRLMPSAQPVRGATSRRSRGRARGLPVPAPGALAASSAGLHEEGADVPGNRPRPDPLPRPAGDPTPAAPRSWTQVLPLPPSERVAAP